MPAASGRRSRNRERHVLAGRHVARRVRRTQRSAVLTVRERRGVDREGRRDLLGARPGSGVRLTARGAPEVHGGSVDQQRHRCHPAALVAHSGSDRRRSRDRSASTRHTAVRGTDLRWGVVAYVDLRAEEADLGALLLAFLPIAAEAPATASSDREAVALQLGAGDQVRWIERRFGNAEHATRGDTALVDLGYRRSPGWCRAPPGGRLSGSGRKPNPSSNCDFAVMRTDERGSPRSRLPQAAGSDSRERCPARCQTATTARAGTPPSEHVSVVASASSPASHACAGRRLAVGPAAGPHGVRRRGGGGGRPSKCDQQNAGGQARRCTKRIGPHPAHHCRMSGAMPPVGARQPPRAPGHGRPVRRSRCGVRARDGP